MRKVCFIINPVSGGGKSIHAIPLIKTACDAHTIEYAIKVSKDEFELVRLSRDAVSSGFTDIIAVGGDGTLREVLSGIYNEDVRLGLIPTGTGNDFALTLGIPSDIESAIQIVIDGYADRIDVAIANDKPFLNVLSWGIDSDIITNLPKFKKMIKGKESYLVSALNTIIRYNPISLKYSIDDRPCQTSDIALVAIGNGKYFGGGMKITPNAIVNDGKLDVCIIEAMAKHKLLRFLPKVFSGAHLKVPGVRYIKCEKIEMELNDNNVLLNLDGDLFDEEKVRVIISNNGVNFIVDRKNGSSN